ncbi:hypothetical protein A176_007437 [Myxococcus hansupus]|uniref:Uncharacterized protein n=1 Tax=Pseudomyxococcus hansupus TaxID=1297742 RepID=A0A0H4XA73_9BACT|nr:hypothetical protein A176_007437 [Myxococcus hansupus]
MGSTEKKWRTAASADRVFDAGEAHPSAVSSSHPAHLPCMTRRDMAQ